MMNSMGFGFTGFDTTFSIMGILFFVMFALVLCVFIVAFIKGIGQWNKNNHSPRLTVPATVVAKRTDVSHHRHKGANDHVHHSSSTWYYVTFEVDSGDRMEFSVTGPEYGMLIEGDKGNLSFQGTRYQGFERL